MKLRPLRGDRRHPWRTSVEDKRLTCWDWNFGFKLGIQLGFALPASGQRNRKTSPKPSQDDQKSGSWERLGRLLGQLGGILSALGGVLDVLERSWRHLGWNLEHIGSILDVLGPSWGVLGGLGGFLRDFWGFQGAFWKHFFEIILLLKQSMKT